VQAKEGRAILYRELTEHIFVNNNNPAVHEAYQADKGKFSKSTRQQFLWSVEYQLSKMLGCLITNTDFKKLTKSTGISSK